MSDEFDEAAPAGVVLPVSPQVVRQLGDPVGEECYLNLRGTGVGVIPAVFLDQNRFLVAVQPLCSLFPDSGPPVPDGVRGKLLQP